MALIDFEVEHEGTKITGKIETDISTAEFDPILKASLAIKNMNNVDINVGEYQKLITLASVKECSAYKAGSHNEWDKLGSKIAAKITAEAVKHYPLLPYLTQMATTVAGSESYSISDISSAPTSSDGTKKP